MRIPFQDKERILTALITEGNYSSNKLLLEKYIIELQKINPEYNMTESTLSKDLHKLEFVKDDYRIWRVSDLQREKETKKSLIPIWNSEILEVGNDFDLVYIGTKVGSSEYIAKKIKELLSEQIIGSICGSDTIILLTRDKKLTMDELEKLSNVRLINKGGYDLPEVGGKFE